VPSNVVHSKRDEEKWEKAKAIAAKEGKGRNFAYIMGIYKRMKPSHRFKGGKKERVVEKLSQAQMPISTIKPPKVGGAVYKTPKFNPLTEVNKWSRSQGSNSLKSAPPVPPPPKVVVRGPNKPKNFLKTAPIAKAPGGDQLPGPNQMGRT